MQSYLVDLSFPVVPIAVKIVFLIKISIMLVVLEHAVCFVMAKVSSLQFWSLMDEILLKEGLSKGDRKLHPWQSSSAYQKFYIRWSSMSFCQQWFWQILVVEQVTQQRQKCWTHTFCKLSVMRTIRCSVLMKCSIHVNLLLPFCTY